MTNSKEYKSILGYSHIDFNVPMPKVTTHEEYVFEKIKKILPRKEVHRRVDSLYKINLQDILYITNGITDVSIEHYGNSLILEWIGLESDEEYNQRIRDYYDVNYEEYKKLKQIFE